MYSKTLQWIFHILKNGGVDLINSLIVDIVLALCLVLYLEVCCTTWTVYFLCVLLSFWPSCIFCDCLCDVVE